MSVSLNQQTITSRNMRWAGHVARMEILEMYTTFWLENLKEKDHSQDLGVDEKILDCILQK